MAYVAPVARMHEQGTVRARGNACIMRHRNLLAYSIMKNLFIGVSLVCGVTLAGCTTQEKKIIKELEDMPGVTCDVNATNGLDDCGPDNLQQMPNTGA